MQLTREKIIKEVENLDPKLKKTDEAFKVATILLAGIQIGASIKKIANFLELPLEDIKKYDKNLRENGVWVKDKTAMNWFDKESGSIAFWMDVSVAMGYMGKRKRYA